MADPSSPGPTNSRAPDPSTYGSATSGPATPDPEIAETLAYVRRTLEVIAFLLAVLVAQSGGIGLLVGVAAIFVLLWNAAEW